MHNPLYEVLRKAAAQFKLDETTQLLTVAGYLTQLNSGLDPEKFTDAAATFCKDSGLPTDNFIYLLTGLIENTYTTTSDDLNYSTQPFEQYLADVCKAYEEAMRPKGSGRTYVLENVVMTVKREPYQLEFFAHETVSAAILDVKAVTAEPVTAAPPAVKAPPVPKELRVVDIELPIKRDEYDVIVDLLDRAKTPGPMIGMPIGADLGKWIGSVKEEPTLSFIAMVINAEAGPWLDAFLTDGVNICGSPRPTTDLSKPLIVRYKDTEYRAGFKLI